MSIKNPTQPIPSRRTLALRYAGRGWPVLPMHTVKAGACSCKNANCKTPGKHPRTAHGVNDATTDKSQIKSWFAKWPRSNIGIAARVQSRIIVLDIDPRNGGDTTLGEREIELGPLPTTVTSITGGGGRHLFFKHPAFAVKKDSTGKLFGRGVDVLSNGCLVIMSPSSHVSGKKYAWQDGRSINDMELAELPSSWLQRLDGEVPDKAVAEAPNSESQVTEGGRNNHLTRLGGTLRRFGASRNAIKAAVKAENIAHCSPSLDEVEVRRIVASVMKYPVVPNGSDAADGLTQVVLDRRFSSGKHLLLGTDNRFWHYNDRFWKPVSDQWVSGRILETIQSTVIKGQKTASLMGQTLSLLKAKLAVKEDVLSFVKDPPPVINCKNGELWIADDGAVELRPHQPESFLRDCLDVAYDPAAKCLEYDKAVLEIFDEVEKPKAMVRHWNELLGYIIQANRNIPIIVLLGGGDNGKTKLIGTAIRLLGKQLVQAQRVEALDKSQFAMGSLLGKRLFVDDDVKAGARLPDGTLKTISEAKEVTGELKFYPSFNFIVRTVPVLLCNNIPSLGDLSHGMQRRLMVIPFDREFTDEDKDTNLFERIWANELSGVLNRALKGYKRLIERNFQFKRPLPIRVATEKWLQQANPLPGFLAACCVKDATCHTLMKEFYAAYVAWTGEMGFTLTQTQQTVTRNLEHLHFATTHANKGLAVIGLKITGHG